MSGPTEAEALEERDRAVAELDAAIAKRDRAVAELDLAVAERDFVLKFFIDLGEALGKASRLDFHRRRNGAVEIRTLYPSLADAEADMEITRSLRAMAALAEPRAQPSAAARRRIASEKLSPRAR
jgi:hypothetical protein